MKVCILTTKTKHHTYFINKLAEEHEVSVVYETRKLHKDYPTGPFFEEEESGFEELFFSKKFGSVPTSLDKTKISTHFVGNVNSHAALLEDADIAISFGTGLIKPHLFNTPKMGTINVHRGIASKYRGLDSDLWAIYNKDIDNIGVTLHYVDEKLDTGSILRAESLCVMQDMEVYHLKFWTTIMATDMMLNTLRNLHSIEPKEQKKIGEYYSAMPLDKKMECVEIFKSIK
tara:strand:- start:2543 stop:3232 length:690 start_codon:yes stop_codon:yes gene_type:complete